MSAEAIVKLAGGLTTQRGSYYFVDANAGNDDNAGLTPDEAFATIQMAVDSVASFAPNNSYIFVAPGQYDETVTIARSGGITNLTIIGLGGRGAAYIEPSTEDAAGMVVHADDVTLINLGVAAEDDTSAVALTVTGARFRAYGCKIEGGAQQLLIGPGTVAQEAAGTHGTGADALIDDCEICWGTEGIVLQGTDYGGCTQTYIRNSRFHDLTASSIGENVGSGGSAAVTFFGLNVRNCTFEDLEDGTAPTAWCLLNGDNANTGVISNNSFPTAINSGDNLVSTAVHWVSNYHTGGVSTAQPS